MELRALARLVLESARLEDKLVSPDCLTDERPGPEGWAPPPAPARPPRLRLDDPRPRARFPRPSELHRPEARGRALHFFANHELLAAELMAVCLLRFPGAPPGFRLGVARTLLEELGHLRRYRSRMAELGVELGDVPVGDHFWRALAGMGRPLDYVTGMSLVFEQANLDHAAAWARRFDAAEDAATAALMRQVLEDEVGHVRHGAVWFERWRASGAPFEAFRAALPGGLDPVRARGPEVEVDARRRAGLSEGFIRELVRYRAPKGRRPRLWVFTPEVEAELARGGPPSASVRALIADLAPTFGILGSDDDLVWAPRAPSPRFDEALARAGLPTPRRIEALEDAARHRPDAIRPWGLGPGVRARLREVARSVRVGLPERDDRALLHKGLVLPARRRFAARGWLDSDRVGALVEDLAALEAALEGAGRPMLLKAPYSASGQSRRIVGDRLEGSDRGWAERVLAREGALLVEPWLDRRADLGLVFPPEGGRPTLLRFLTTPRGGYLGHVLAPIATALGPELTQPLARFEGGVRGLVDRMTEEARRLVPEGPLGVDLLIESDRSGRLRLQPWVEVNARFTMGHIALALQRRLAPGRVGLWIHVHRGVLGRGGFASFGELARAVAPSPPETRRLAGGRLQITGGILPTNDPDQARQILTFLVVADTLTSARDRLPEVLRGLFDPWS